ncbi:MAG: acylphosphatase [bacterium]|nr:acylphosphatase [bacterium]
MNDVCARIRVSGRVQGVGFRYFAMNWAEKLGLCGWVRNNWDGSVESEVEGDRSAVEEYINQIKIGPRWGHVSKADVEYKTYQGDYRQFDITR